uniref:Putative nucleic acid-binding protein n=1 Tax=Tabanus bromius TaxID=304241 RepID=A0A0K8TTP4_TABBR
MENPDIATMKVADLKRELRLRGLSATGNKTELQERLQASLLEGDLTLDDTAIPEGLLDDDDVLTDEEKSGIDLAHEDAVLKTPPIEEEKSSPTNTAPAKKVVLKRNISHTFPTLSEFSNNSMSSGKETDAPPNKAAKPESDDGDKTTDDDNKHDESKKVVKISDLSLKDRLEMRAKKFGLQVTGGTSGTSGTGASGETSTKQQARAIRFGQSNEDKASANGTNTSIDVLKKRAERFGCSVSSRMTELELKEKLQKRQERFGLANANKTDTDKVTAPGSGTNIDYAEKAKQRLERFKAAVK